MMHFYFSFNPGESDRVLHVRLADKHNLETPFERRIFLDVLAIFVQRRRANRAQLSRARAGFNIFEASIDPSAAPAPMSVCNSSIKRMIFPRNLRSP